MGPQRLFQNIELWKGNCAKLKSDLNRSQLLFEYEAPASKTGSRQDSPHWPSPERRIRSQEKRSAQYEEERSDFPLQVLFYTRRSLEELSRHFHECTSAEVRESSFKSITFLIFWASDMYTEVYHLIGDWQGRSVISEDLMGNEIISDEIVLHLSGATLVTWVGTRKISKYKVHKVVSLL